MTDYGLTGLVQRRAALTGEIEAIHERQRGLFSDLESLDATILQFDPSHRVEAIRPRSLRLPADWWKGADVAHRALYPAASRRAVDHARHCPGASGRTGD